MPGGGLTLYLVLWLARYLFEIVFEVDASLNGCLSDQSLSQALAPEKKRKPNCQDLTYSHLSPKPCPVVCCQVCPFQLPHPTPPAAWDLETWGRHFSFPLPTKSLSLLGKILFLCEPRYPSSAPEIPPIRCIRTLAFLAGIRQTSVLSLPCYSLAVGLAHTDLSFSVFRVSTALGAWLGIAYQERAYPWTFQRKVRNSESCGQPSPTLPHCCISSTGGVCHQPGPDEFSAPAKL